MKKTPNQIREELRRQLAKQHNDEIENLKQLKTQYWERLAKAEKECRDLKRENEELKEKVNQYEDWNRRLMEFMDMSEDDRKAIVKETKARLESETKLNSLMGLYGQIFSLMM